jgi:hypothetical protein
VGEKVTIAACFKFDDGIVFCADTKISTDVKTTRTKIFPNYYGGMGSLCATVFTLAGSVRYAQAAIGDCERRISKLDFSQVSMDEIRREIEVALVDFYRRHIYPNPDRERDRIDFELLAGIFLRGETGMFMSENDVVVPVSDYECIGTGAYLARYWIRQFFESEKASRDLKKRTIEDISIISTYALSRVMEYDESCGGEAEFLIMNNDGEISSDIDASIHPCEELPSKFQTALWPMLRKLARAKNKLESDTVIEDFVQEVRRIGQERGDWIERIADILKSSLQDTFNVVQAPIQTTDNPRD